MAVIYMKHKQHGTKVAISEDEAKNDEKNGWERYQVGALLTPTEAPLIDASIAKAVSELPATPDELSALRTQYAEKFGKKPHHKKGTETLRKELEEA